jgi:hypothetical protein
LPLPVIRTERAGSTRTVWDDSITDEIHGTRWQFESLSH